MSTTVTYKGNTLTTVNNQTRTLNTSGKWMEGDITLVDVTGSGNVVVEDVSNSTGVGAEIDADIATLITKSITSNGTYNASSDNADGYSSVTVNVSGGSSTLVSKSITANGTYDPANDSADGYSSVTVNVPNSYAAGDEGKVVHNGALTSQTSATYTTNNTYDTTLINSVTVNVSGGGSGGNALATETGTFTGSGGITAQISCDFEPREIYIYGDLSSDATLRGVVSFALVKDNFLYMMTDSSQNNTVISLGVRCDNITGFNEANSSSEPYATYSNGVLTIDNVDNTSSRRFASGITYSYKLIGVITPTQHTIHLEFSDSTDTTITAYYDSTFISDVITATTPTTYGQKTVTLAQLDGVTWYEYDPSETWETILNTTTVNYYEDSNITYPYCWIGSLSSVSITVGSVWRITYEGTEYRCTAVTASVPNVGNTAVIGNPKYSGATDDGTEVPFSFVNAGWGAWTGGINAENVDTTKTVKIERLVS